MAGVIYCITNLESGKAYIGSSLDFESRKRQHLKDLKAGTHHCCHLQNAWNKYGKELFEFSFLEEDVDKEILFQRERYWIEYYNTHDRDWGYNLAIPTDNGGHTHAEETKERQRASAYETYNRLVEEGYYTCILYNLNNNTFTEYNSSQEAKANSFISKNKKSNFNKGEVIIPKRLFTQDKLDKIVNRYNRYKETQGKGSTKSDTIYAVNAYDFTDIKVFPSKTNACVTLFGSGNETNQISKVIDTNNKFRWHYFFSSEESMDNLLPTCHLVQKGNHSVNTNKEYKYILNHPDNSSIYLYKAVDAINHIPNSTTKGIKKLITREKSHYYNYTLEKICAGVEEVYS